MLTLNNKIAVVAVAVLFAVSCKAAKYEIVKGEKNSQPLERPLTPENETKDPTFRIEAPATGTVGTPITVTGFDCGPNNTGRITFNSPDSLEKTKTGTSAEFKFERAGTYTIVGTCSQDGKADQTSSRTIVISNGGGQNGQNGQSGQSGQSGQNP